MKKILFIAALCCFLAGCSKGTDEIEKEPDTPIVAEEIVNEETTYEESKVDTDVQKVSDEATLTAVDETAENLSENIILGDEQIEQYIPLLESKRVALFSNQTGIVGDAIYDENGAVPDEELLKELGEGKIHFGSGYTEGKHILDVLLEKNIDVVEVLTPEHGFRGSADAGATVNDTVDAKTGIFVRSLYGGCDNFENQDIAKIDTVVIDLQDIGLRYYTYYITMYYLLDVCAKHDIEVILLDRPNPNGFYVDGPILKEGYSSGVGNLPICMVHGMTLGELARMMNGEGWFISGKDKLRLTVIPCENYSHSMKPMIIKNPSPNIKSMKAVYLYASTCFFENTVVSVGRGTEEPFVTYGSPLFDGVAGYEYSFVPKSMEGAKNPQYQDRNCYGKSMQDADLESLWDEGIQLDYLIDAYWDLKDKTDAFFGKPDKKGRYWIDLLSGSDDLRKQIESGKSAAEIKASWSDEINMFKEQRRPYLLYEE